MSIQGSSQDMNSKTTENELINYAVVRFLGEDGNNEELATVPKKWIFYNKSEVNCRWPTKKKNIQHLIKKGVEPEVEWTIHHCQITREFNDYNTARSYEKRRVDMESSEAESIRLPKVLGRGQRKKFTKNDFSSDSSSSHDNSWEDLRKEMQCDKNTPEMKSTSDNNVSETIPTNIVEIDQTPIVLLENPGSNTCNPIEFTYSEESAINSNIMLPFTQGIIDLKIQMDIIQSKLDYIIGKLEFTTAQTPGRNVIIKLLLEEIDEIKDLEKRLVSEDETKIEMGRIFQLVGGSDAAKLIRRALSRVFTDDVAAKCSWTGAKNNFKIRDLTLIKELKNVVQRVFPSTTEFEFERVIKDFFRYGEQRKSRKK